jgi:Ca2+-binding RTX toxin-like protein
MRRIQNGIASSNGRFAAVEPLETRTMLAAHGAGALATAALEGNTLVINGSRANDVITVAVDGSDPSKLDVTLNGTTTTFNLADVLSIRANGGRGHDDIRVDAAVALHAELHGGVGDDTLRGGSGDDLLDGGNGKDDLDGGAGNDHLRGGNGKDRLAGGAGDDDLHGDNGSDDLSGDDGDDTLVGGHGKDHCDGGAGSDTFDQQDEAADMGSGDCLLVHYADLPAAVRAAFKADFPGATATQVKQEEQGNTLDYELDYTTAGGATGEVLFDAAGNVVVH